MLKKSHFISMLLFGLLLAVVALIQLNSVSKTHVKQNTALQIDINACGAIADKSIAHLVAVVEFQKLEIIGRRAKVMRDCMQDHGYSQNPAWETFIKPIAQKKADVENSSFNEAFENLRRLHMEFLEAPANNPNYWIKTTKPAPK